jgi:hypothetical protein
MILFAGEQKTITIGITDKSGNIIDLSGCTDITAKFIVNGSVIRTYAMTDFANNVTVGTGNISFTIQEADTTTLADGLKWYIQFDLDWSDGTKKIGITSENKIQATL